MLAETRAELDDFHQASKELEAELENELQRTEKAQQDLQAKVIRAEGERDEWKVHYNSWHLFLQCAHTSRPSSCLYRQHITRRQRPCRGNWIDYGRNINKSRYICESLKWETMTWNATRGPFLRAWRTWRTNIREHSKKRFFLNMNYWRRLILRRKHND
jgi:hypothetical protein